MNIEIRKLTPDLAEEYAHFFDETPHDVNIDERKCYCVTWRSDAAYADNSDHWFPSREERRKRAIQFIKSGSLQGYLAYHNNKIVGWCNANADCQGCVDYLREYWPIEEYRTDIKVKSIFCFVIAPDMQRKGIATQLVEHICKDAANDGFDFVEAYPSIKPTDATHHYVGFLEMYEKCGFTIQAEKGGKVVMRKELNSNK
ncbi:MAG: GNAT family N-acetyltransferase [Defluviitaleaceae bacterium]|nr:GNAT family N-acetyltransferase [Defluviitaleaceae bacterium]